MREACLPLPGELGEGGQGPCHLWTLLLPPCKPETPPPSRNNSRIFSATLELCFLSQQMLRLLALKSLLLWKFKAVLAVGYNKSLSQYMYYVSISAWALEPEAVKLGRGSLVTVGSWNMCWCQWDDASTCAVAKPWLRQQCRAELAVLPSPPLDMMVGYLQYWK